jgi:hypothetical protein
MTTHRPHRLATLLAAGITAAALAAPPALARPADGPNEPLRPDSGAPVVQSIDDGFDWGSAAIGAGGTGGLMTLLSLGGFAYASRRRIQATS